MARSKASKPSLTMAYLSLLLAAVGVVLSLVALVGIWWFGEINPAIFGGAFKGRGPWPRDREHVSSFTWDDVRPRFLMAFVNLVVDFIHFSCSGFQVLEQIPGQVASACGALRPRPICWASVCPPPSWNWMMVPVALPHPCGARPWGHGSHDSLLSISHDHGNSTRLSILFLLTFCWTAETEGNGLL